jgi:vitamin B12 transporter
VAVTRALAAILLLVSVACAQNGATVEIRCDEATPRINFSVWLWPGGQQAVSDEQGRVRFTELPAGDYRAEIVADGYSPADTSFVLLSGENRILNVKLTFLATTLPDVFVQTERSSPAVLTFTRKDFERSSAPDLAEFLAQQAGMDVQSDGIEGAAKTVRIGGSNANQVLVLVDGTRWQANGSGTADLASIPVNWVDRVDVYRGSRTEVGGEGIGGVIQIVTRNPQGRNALNSELTMRETTQHFSVSREHKVRRFGALMAYSRLQGLNNFRYRISEEDGTGAFTPDLGRTFKRQNARVARDQLLVKFMGELSHHWSGWVTAAWDRCARGMPGYLAPMMTPDAEQETAQSVVNAQATRTGRVNNLRLRVSYQDGWKEYRDPNRYALIQHSEERSRSAEAEVSVRWNLQQHAMVGYGASAARESIGGDHLGSDPARRDRWALWSSYRKMLLETHSWNVSGEAGMRAEGFGDDHALLPKLEISAMQTTDWHSGLDIALGRSYRAPDFYALFWQDDQLAVGNPALKPERSSEWTGTAYVETPWVASTRLEVNGSWQRVDELIYWHRSFDNRWKPLNLKAASIRTAGVSVTQDLDRERWRLQIGAEWTDARDATDDRNTGGKHLTFRPLNAERAALSYGDQGLSGEVSLRRVSERPILETNSKWLQAYQLVDAQIGYTFHVRRVELEPQIGVSNLLNENYRVIRFAPMPLREWYLTVRMRTL